MSFFTQSKDLVRWNYWTYTYLNKHLILKCQFPNAINELAVSIGNLQDRIWIKMPTAN